MVGTTTYIQNPNYATLAEYAVLGATGVAFPATSPGITLTDGYYASSPTATITGFVNGSAAVNSGNNIETGLNSVARTQSASLFNELTALTADYITLGSGPNYSFEPGVYSIAGDINFVFDDTLTFTNQNFITNPQWVFRSTGAITITNLTSTTFFPGTEKSVYWLANTSIAVTTNAPTLQGIFLAKGNISFNDTTELNYGAVYAGVQTDVGTVTFTSPPMTFTGLGLTRVFIEQYATLRGYVVYASGPVTFSSDGDGTSLSGGVYGSTTNTVSGKVEGNVVTSGNNIPGDVQAKTDLENMYFRLTSLTATYNTLGTGPNYIFEPGVYEITTGDINFTATDTIEFRNTQNIINPQWVFITLGTLNFTGLDSITYLPDTEQRIYWLATSTITIDGDSSALLKGIFIGPDGVTFNSFSAPNLGAAYAGGIAPSPPSSFVTFTEQTVTQGFGYQAICFLEGTPINTDQGIVAINKIIADFHTIDNKRIVAVTQTRDSNTFLVCFKKDSLGENVPSQDTITSRFHRVEYNGEMIKACDLMESVKNVVKVDYTGQLLYNILMEKHDKMIVNNLVCETLHPDNPAKRLNRANFVKLSIPTTIECV
jgi:hypothetical protein